MILGAMISGGGVGPFIDVPSLLIVIGGTFFLGDVHLPIACFPCKLWRDGEGIPSTGQKDGSVG
jgi:hypothetical protein